MAVAKEVFHLTESTLTRQKQYIDNLFDKIKIRVDSIVPQIPSDNLKINDLYLRLRRDRFELLDQLSRLVNQFYRDFYNDNISLKIVEKWVDITQKVTSGSYFEPPLFALEREYDIILSGFVRVPALRATVEGSPIRDYEIIQMKPITWPGIVDSIASAVGNIISQGHEASMESLTKIVNELPSPLGDIDPHELLDKLNQSLEILQTLPTNETITQNIDSLLSTRFDVLNQQTQSAISTVLQRIEAGNSNLLYMMDGNNKRLIEENFQHIIDALDRHHLEQQEYVTSSTLRVAEVCKSNTEGLLFIQTLVNQLKDAMQTLLPLVNSDVIEKKIASIVDSQFAGLRTKSNLNSRKLADNARMIIKNIKSTNKDLLQRVKHLQVEQLRQEFPFATIVESLRGGAFGDADILRALLGLPLMKESVLRQNVSTMITQNNMAPSTLDEQMLRALKDIPFDGSWSLSKIHDAVIGNIYLNGMINAPFVNMLRKSLGRQIREEFGSISETSIVKALDKVFNNLTPLEWSSQFLKIVTEATPKISPILVVDDSDMFGLHLLAEQFATMINVVAPNANHAMLTQHIESVWTRFDGDILTKIQQQLVIASVRSHLNFIHEVDASGLQTQDPQSFISALNHFLTMYTKLVISKLPLSLELAVGHKILNAENQMGLLDRFKQMLEPQSEQIVTAINTLAAKINGQQQESVRGLLTKSDQIIRGQKDSVAELSRVISKELLQSMQNKRVDLREIKELINTLAETPGGPVLQVLSNNLHSVIELLAKKTGRGLETLHYGNVQKQCKTPIDRLALQIETIQALGFELPSSVQAVMDRHNPTLDIHDNTKTIINMITATNDTLKAVMSERAHIVSDDRHPDDIRLLLTKLQDNVTKLVLDREIDMEFDRIKTLARKSTNKRTFVQEYKQSVVDNQRINLKRVFQKLPIDPDLVANAFEDVSGWHNRVEQLIDTLSDSVKPQAMIELRKSDIQKASALRLIDKLEMGDEFLSSNNDMLEKINDILHELAGLPTTTLKSSQVDVKQLENEISVLSKQLMEQRKLVEKLSTRESVGESERKYSRGRGKPLNRYLRLRTLKRISRQDVKLRISQSISSRQHARQLVKPASQSAETPSKLLETDSELGDENARPFPVGHRPPTASRKSVLRQTPVKTKYVDPHTNRPTSTIQYREAKR